MKKCICGDDAIMVSVFENCAPLAYGQKKIKPIKIYNCVRKCTRTPDTFNSWYKFVKTEKV